MAWEQKVYIASFKGVETLDNGNEVATYEQPVEYFICHQPASSFMSYKNYGDETQNVRIAYVNVSQFYGKIKVKDKAYLKDGENQNDNIDEIVNSDNEYCGKANYEVVAVQPNRLKIKIDFKKIK